jgi:hypothetical protein
MLTAMIGIPIQNYFTPIGRSVFSDFDLTDPRGMFKITAASELMPQATVGSSDAVCYVPPGFQ